ncbi:SCP2 sterol-binding domain-containing protein [Micromonospora sp. DSM 115977]|uniref:SCP2 sterol-binding domain-containing protein n=1 Tax=Micromonospora reichwaldensis TaxID=3075516 RepID=A0ABU2WVF1_9ACTN|nr:SCP2 sterol-binding domain-containing protein [Micromonospora sp. DSM 115977]MDT0529902.1 SCP2 sterol-binding domain-containing protein [Micromonospora sp. DSM 115977]
MVDATTRFFEDLDRRGHDPLLAKSSGTLRLDLHEGAHTTHWLLRIDRGRLQVSQEDQEADTVVGTSPELFEELAAGRENGVAALLRGDMTVSGDLRLVVQMERLFPGHPDARGPRRHFELHREVR